MPYTKEAFSSPTAALQSAIEKLKVFHDASNLDVNERGELVAMKSTRLDHIVSLAKRFVSPFFFDQKDLQEEKLRQIKEIILTASDVVRTHSPLLLKLQQGEPAERRLAESAMEVIKKYNAIILEAQNNKKIVSYSLDDKIQILLDNEIKDSQIELPPMVSIKYESHPGSHLAQQTLKALSTTFLLSEKKIHSPALTHKKMMQAMIDAFQIKAIRLIQTHVPPSYLSLGIRQLVKLSPITVEIEENSSLIVMRQTIELIPGSIMFLTGFFERKADSKFMMFPVLKDLNFTLDLTQPGFPYPSQHTSWSLADSLVDANPLRSEQMPLFKEIQQRKKNMSYALLHDPTMIAKARQVYQNKKLAFDQNLVSLLPLHRQLMEALLEVNQQLIKDRKWLETFYATITQCPSVFNELVYLQQRLLDLFITQPAKKLQEEWLVENSPLRVGSDQEKFNFALMFLEEEEKRVLLNSQQVENLYILKMGPILGGASRMILLQYMSEKMGFPPPMLNEFTQRIQACAFQQVQAFLRDLENPHWNSQHVSQQLQGDLEADIYLLTTSNFSTLQVLSVEMTQEAEEYFGTRFYIKNYKT
jgi:hypothetical protein